jgi:hypothetical protein
MIIYRRYARTEPPAPLQSSQPGQPAAAPATIHAGRGGLSGENQMQTKTIDDLRAQKGGILPMGAPLPHVPLLPMLEPRCGLLARVLGR